MLLERTTKIIFVNYLYVPSVPMKPISFTKTCIFVFLGQHVLLIEI